MTRWIGVGAVAMTLAGTATAQAAPMWLPPKGLSSGSTAAMDNEVAGDAGGSSLMGWRQNTMVSVLFRPAGGNFGTVRTISGTNASLPQIAMNERGDGFAAWCRAGQAELAARPVGQLFLAEEPLGACAATPDDRLDVAAGTDGSALVAWAGAGGTCSLQVRGRLPSGALTAQQSIGGCPAGAASAPRIAQNARGDAVVLFIQNNQVWLAARVGTGAFSDAEAVSGAGVSSPSVALSPAGQVTAVWLEGAQVMATRDVVGDPDFPTGTNISTGGTPGPPDVAVSGAGESIAAWAVAGNALQTASAPATGPFGSPAGVPGSSPSLIAAANRPDVEFSSNGSAIVLFGRTDGGFARLHGAVRPVGQGFQAALPVSNMGQNTSRQHLAVDRQGNATAVWSNAEGTSHLVLAAGYDAAGPAFGGVSTPTSGTVGQSLTFAATVFDVWSATAVGWTFGDGGSAGGLAATHVYGAPGTYTIGVSAVDAVGSGTSMTRAVTINPAPVPDSDGDGFRDNQDCRPANPAIFPGAREIRGNSEDEDCNGKPDPYLDNPTTVSVSWSVRGRRLRLTRFEIKQVPKGGRAEVECKGKNCPFGRKKLGKPRRKLINGFKTLKAKRLRRFRAGQKLEVRVRAPEHFGKLIRYPLKAGETPSSKTFCVRPGERRARKRC